MHLQSLKYFYDACRLQSMTEAALINRVSRPAISQAIKKLEDDLDVSLLHHRKRGFELTAAGQRVIDASMQVFDSVDALKLMAHGQAKTPLKGRVRIGVARVLSTYRFDDALSKLRATHPEMTFKISLENSEQLLDKIESRQLDLAVIISDEKRVGIVGDTLEEGTFVLIKPKSLTQKNWSFALTERRPETDALRRLYEERYGHSLPVFAEIPSWDAIWNWVQKGYCGGLVPSLFLKRSGAKANTVNQLFKSVHPYRVSVYCRETQRNHAMIATITRQIQATFKI